MCPQCQKQSIFKHRWSLTLKDRCEECGLNLENNDSADGPAVLLTFVLGFSIVPLALIADMVWGISMTVNVIVSSLIMLGITLGTMKPLKAYIIALQYKYRKGDWE